MRARPPSNPATFVFALALTLGAVVAQPVQLGADEAASLYTVVDDETGETREKGLSSGIIAGVVVAAILAFSILFGLLWYRLDRQSPERRSANQPPRRLWPWANEPQMRSAQVHTQAGIEGWTVSEAVMPRTSSTSTNNSTSSGSRTVVGSISSTKPVKPPSPSLNASRSREATGPDDSLTQYIQVQPPPNAVLVGPDHGRIGEWCSKAAAKIEGRPVSRVKSWEMGDPEKSSPDPFTA
ncbi:hypothetical protein CspHIS471_0211870 [Cutaneotrichosporon sp. HIS471]|nr:hypothetical protein CspHIS471_0211870 [Cutaneotrichosporon sp. HIS471]